MDDDAYAAHAHAKTLLPIAREAGRILEEAQNTLTSSAVAATSAARRDAERQGLTLFQPLFNLSRFITEIP